MRVIETTTGGFVVRLDLGEEILTSLTEFVKVQDLEGAVIQGIGAVKDSVLGYYDMHEKVYREQAIPEDMELVSLNGNLTWVEGEPFIHAHAALSGEDFVVKGGHLFSSVIAVTGEFHVQPTGVRIERVPDERTGLKLMSDA